MASNCIDTNNQTIMNSLNLRSSNNTNANGEYTLNQIDVFAKELADNLVVESQTNPVTIAENKYGVAFYDATNYLNSTFLKDRDLDDYPSLNNRAIRGPITPIEFADFISLFNLTPNGVITTGTLSSNNLLFELERYYANDIRFGALGGVCTLFESVFAKIDGFFDIIGEVGALIASAVSFLAKAKDLKTFVTNTIDDIVKGKLIEDLKNLIKNEIEQFLAALRAMIQNFNIKEVINGIGVRLNRAAIRTIMQKKDDACLFLSEENSKSISDKIISLFDYAVGLLDNPGLAEIQFLITRFCAFVANVKALLLDFKSPLDQFEFKYTRIANRLKTISNITSSTAIRNGAIRFSPEARQERINIIEQSWEGSSGRNYTPTGEKPVNVREPTISEYSDLPSCQELKDGSDSRIGVRGEWVEDFGMEGWTGLDYDLRVYLLRLQEKLGTKIFVTYGWISQQYNARVGGDPYTSHISGKSVDISVFGTNVSEDEFSKLAIESGFKFIKIYPGSHYHLDTRPMIG